MQFRMVKEAEQTGEASIRQDPDGGGGRKSLRLSVKRQLSSFLWSS